MNWEHRWPPWEPSPDSGSPAERGGCTEDTAYDAELISDPPGWTQPVQNLDPQLDPDSPDYSPEAAAYEAWSEPGPEDVRRMQAYQGWRLRRSDPRADTDREAGF